MSGIPYKLDGLDGDNEVRAKFVSFYATEAIAKGEVVAIDTATSTNGLGNHVKKAESDQAGYAIGLGIAAEAIASGDAGQIQVSGVCTFAILLDENDDAGNLLGVSATGGQLTAMAAATQLPVAVMLSEGTAATADTTVYLLNNHNL